MTARRGLLSGQVELLRKALSWMGGEASVQQLMVKTGLDPRRIDLALRQADDMERASPVKRGANEATDIAERRWRLRGRA